MDWLQYLWISALIDTIIYWHSLQARRNELGSLFRKDIASIDLNRMYLLAVLPPLESWVSAVELSPVWFLIMPCVHEYLAVFQVGGLMVGGRRQTHTQFALCGKALLCLTN